MGERKAQNGKLVKLVGTSCLVVSFCGKGYGVYEDPRVISCQVYVPGVVFVANLRVLGVLGGGRTPSMDISPKSKEFCRYGRLRFKKSARDGCVGEFNLHCNLAVNVSGSSSPSIKHWIKFRIISATAGNFSLASFCKVTKKFLHLCLSLLGFIWLPPAPLASVTDAAVWGAVWPKGALGRGLGIGCAVQTGTLEVATALGATLTIWYSPVFVFTRSWPACPVGILWPVK